MTNRSHRDPVVDFINLLSRAAANRQKKNAFSVSDRSDRTALRELRLHIFAPVRDRFHPTVRFFDHATLWLKTSATFSLGRVVIPSRETILINGKIFPLRSTPPVEVSASAAVSSARNAIAIASS